MTTVPASIPVLRWAAERANIDDVELERRFRKWSAWLTGAAQPTLKQLESFSRLTHIPFGCFFLSEPPQVALPVPDFRTLRDTPLAEPSTELIDTLYLCQQRQHWFREYAQMQGMPRLHFVGRARLSDEPITVADDMRRTLEISHAQRQSLSTWTEALRSLIAKADNAGVLVMVSSIVGSNSHRNLDVGEFRGFVLADDLAPLIFLNGADSKSAQMFTLAHELAHIWLGESGVSNSNAGRVPEQNVERWCNRVAAELLVPLDELRKVHKPNAPVAKEIQSLARFFKVSTLVALRRLYDAGFIDEATLWQYYDEEISRLETIAKERKNDGGDFYRTMGARTGKRFARAVLTSTLEGQTLFRDAFRLLGVRKSETFYEHASFILGHQS